MEYLSVMVNELQSSHPQYSNSLEDWILMRDAYKGERQVKSKNTLYLPATQSHLQDGYGRGSETVGQKAYDAYKKRARFPNFVREAIQMAIGMMHSQPPEIKLPAAMQGIRSTRNESLPDLLRRINTEQLISGRLGLMADLPTKPQPGRDIPYLSTYITERIINWDDGRVEQTVPQTLNLVVLNESEYAREATFTWQKDEKYRVLLLGDSLENEVQGIYKQGIFTNERFDESKLIVPKWRGRTLNKIPFILINSCDIHADVDDPPLLDLGNMCMTIYRGDADYRQNLFMQGQDTFVTIGGNFGDDENVRIGAGARVDMPVGADAKYVGVQSAGLSEQREALNTLEARAGAMGAQTLDTVSRERESGDSLRIRVAARTADLNQIADTGAFALESILKTCAEWMDENPEEVSVRANKEFGEAELSGQSMVEISTARNLGFPISARSMHDLAVKRRITTRTFEEEVALAEQEKNSIFKPAANGDRAPEQPNEE